MTVSNESITQLCFQCYHFTFTFVTAITIGFTDVNYSVNECDGQVSIKVKMIGSLQREVVLYLSTTDQTAHGNPL